MGCLRRCDGSTTKNIKLVEATRTEADALIEKDPDLSKHSALASLARRGERDLHGE